MSQCVSRTNRTICVKKALSPNTNPQKLESELNSIPLDSGAIQSEHF